MRLIIKSGNIVNAGTSDVKQDILIEDGIITKICENIDVNTGVSIDVNTGASIDVNTGVNIDVNTGAKIIDANGLTVLPGLVDAHCHLRDPGQEYKEDIVSGTASAALGGFTAVACMPNTSPAADNAEIVQYIIEKAKTTGYINVFPIGAVTKGLKGEELSEIGEIKNAGAVALSDDGKPVSNPAMMLKALRYSKTFDIPVISHCEDLELADSGDMYEGEVSLELGLRGIPSVSESVQVARDVLLSEYTGVPVHIAHVSTESSINIIRDAKRRGVRVTCETCPHYFTLTDSACRGYDTNAKVAPPLATARDVEAVKAALADGTIDIIATDHAPHHKDEKNVEFSLAARGMIGFETAFGLAYTYLVLPGVLTLAELVEKMSKNPSKLLGLDASRGFGTIGIGNPANISIVDLRRTYSVDPSRFRSKSKNSPFGGYELTGAVLFTVVNGEAVVDNGVLQGGKQQ